MAINERVITGTTAAAGNGGAGSGNQEEGLILHLDANDVDSYDGDGTEWVDIANHEYKPATNPSEHFNTVTYAGQSSAITITASDIGFQPDLVWIKNRDGVYSHRIFDTVRGANERLLPDSTAAESTRSGVYSELSSFSDGFTVDANNIGINSSAGDDYVAWCFKAGGAPTATNTATSGAMTANSVSIDGTLESAYTPTDATIYPKKISANTKLGFSTVLFEGTGDSNNRVPHGLGVSPELIIYKNIDEERSWVVGADAIGWTNTMKLEDDDSAADRAYFDDIKPTSNVFEIYNGQANTANDNNSDFIAYCFASKRGVSKVGSYAGGAAGNKIYTGFEPAFVMVKRTNGSGSWEMFDNKRGKTKKVWANESFAEVTNTSPSYIEFNRDGFSHPITSTGANSSGSTYLYLAFAKGTNETELHDTDLEQHLDADSFPEKGESGYSNTPSTWTALTGSNATISGATFDSELGNYLNFDGSNDYVSIPSSSTTPIDFTSKSYSIECWVNIDSNTIHPILAKYGTTDSLRSTNFTITSSRNLSLYERISSSGHASLSTSALSLNTWHHVCVVRKSSQVEFYIDGELDNTVSATGTPNSGGAQNINIGSQANGNYSFLNGKIGQLRAYSSTLSQAQIRQNYNYTKPNYPNGYNGTITGATWNSAGYFNFDGSTNDVKLNTSNFFSSDFTLSMWWKLDSTSGYQMLFGMQGYGSSSYNGIGHYINGSTIHTWVQIGGSGSAIGQSSSILSTGTWHNIVLLREGSTWKHYLDGALVGTYANKTTAAMNSPESKIGEHFSNSGYNTDGKCSKVKVYDRALSDSEITALHSEGE